MHVQMQFEGIRCFSEPQEALIRPLTLLVGENSSGKTTFLALRQLASSLTRGVSQELSFNEPPFLLGAYDQIASHRGGRAGRAKSFSIEVSLDGNSAGGSIRAQFVPKNGQPWLQTWRLKVGNLVWQVKSRDDGADSLILESPRGKQEFPRVPAYLLEAAIDLPEVLSHFPDFKDIGAVLTRKDVDSLGKTLLAIRQEFGQQTYAFAPIRTSPQRTYDPVSSEPKPEGSHVPMLLSQLSHSTSKSHWTKLGSALKDFGARSGLFDEIEVIRKGKKRSDPFQIGVKTGGPAFNLVDVGYGVSQALPILVDIMRRSSGDELFLLQQPEVHLHPKAQAELGTFFARQAADHGRFVIETHSDYLVDRVRTEIRRGTIRCEDVALLYFERSPKHGAVIHNIELTKDGRIRNPPIGYRQFFLNEERELLDI